MNSSLQLLVVFLLLQYGSCLRCYECETASKSGCRETGKGNLTECPSDRNQGCFITVSSDPGSCGEEDCGDQYEMGCVDYTDPDAYGCVEHFVGNIEIRSCNCKGDGCNEDLDKASGEPLKCYQCESLEQEECGPETPGNLTQCPFEAKKGCFISETSEPGKNTTTFARGCTELSDETKYKCDDFTFSGIELKYCNCHGNGCNKDFGTTGGSNTLASSLVVVLLGIFRWIL